MKANLKQHAPSLAIFFAVVVALNLPLVLNLTTHVVGRNFEDVFEVLWLFEWMKTAVFERHINPFYSPDVFYPQGWYLASGPQPSWYILAFAPLTALVGSTAAYNLVTLATFVFGGFGTYLLVFKLTEHRAAGVIAGFVYMVAPILTLRMGGHLNILLAGMWLPYVLLSAYQALLAPKRTKWRWVILSGLLCALMVLSAWYFLFIGTIPLIGLILVANGESGWKDRLLTVAGIGIICAILVAPAAYSTWTATQKTFGSSAGFSLAESDGHSMSPDRMFLPNLRNPLWRKQVRPLYGSISGESDFVSIGYAALVLAIVGIIMAPRKQVKPLAVVAGIALMLALGTTLHWRGQRVEIQAPPVVEQAYRSLNVDLNTEGVPILLPGAFLHRFLPFYSSMRAWGRYDIALMLVIATLAGLGAAYLMRRSKLGAAAAILLGAIVLVEGNAIPYDNFTAVSINHRQANEWFASLPPGQVLIEYPQQLSDKIAMYSQAFHGQRIVNGAMAQQPLFLAEAKASLGMWPIPESIPILHKWQVDYVVVNVPNNELFDQEILPVIESIPELCPVRRFDDSFMDFIETWVYKVLAPGEKCETLG